MTKLPEKGLLSGSKTPHTTTGEMKEALGRLRDYLNELLGEDSADKETARQALGIDLKVLSDKIEAKADQETLEETMKNKVDQTLFESKTDELEQEIAKRGTPVGTIEFFAMTTPPAGYLRADGAEVGRETWPQLFAAIGTTFGAGNGETTFNLPDLAGRFAQGSMTPGQKIEAGLPNITGTINNPSPADTAFTFGGEWPIAGTSNPGALTSKGNLTNKAIAESSWTGGSVLGSISFDAGRSNSIYGASATVQPPALTLLPCIKAFDAVTDPGLIDITGLANELAAHKHVTETYNDGTNWYRKWSDGWLEQGGFSGPFNSAYGRITLSRPYAGTDYSVQLTPTGRPYNTPPTVLFDGNNDKNMTTTGFYVGGNDWVSGYVKWYACGQGTQS